MITLDLLKANWPEILRIAAGYGADRIRVFGSVARGEATAQSDLDLLVRLAPGRTLLDLIAIKQDVEDLLGYPVDVVTEASLSPHIRDQILLEARPLF
ncbi:MAG: nucleotidyltransferase family protein [Blastocatellia bacterium]|nr:nucleotidyltransferase family protein [Blastocatellia bacterium]